MSSAVEPLKPSAGQPSDPSASIKDVGASEIRIKGQTKIVPSVEIGNRTVIADGKWIKVGEVRHEELVEGDTVRDPESFVAQLRKSGLKVDLFTFAQRVPECTCKYSYHTEWENAASIAITTFDHWWKDLAEYSIRKAVNRARKLGVVTRVVKFDDEFVKAACPIYNEVSVRQGKAFWHYGKDFQTIKHELNSYLDRSIFIGAYLQDELIGFMKITWVGTTGTITQILSKMEHFDKRPNNALIAKAIELCEVERKSHFIYGSFVYYDSTSSLTEFKKRNGFEALPLPRYYIPVTLKGRVALALGIHRGINAFIPKPMFRQLRKLRSVWYAQTRKFSSESE